MTETLTRSASAPTPGTTGVQSSGGKPNWGSWITRAVILVLVIGLTSLIMFGDFERELIGGLSVVLMLVLMFLKIPVAFSLAIPSIIGVLALRPRAVVTMLQSVPYDEVASWSLSVIPLFVLMGLLLWRSGITDTLYGAANKWLGWLPGGLAVSTNFAGAGLAAMSGSTIGTTYALARIGIPQMLNQVYDKRLATGAVIVAGLPGQLIPPSVFLIIYAGIAEVPVGPQLMAGFGPGILVALLMAIMIIAFAIVRPKLAGRGKDVVREPISWGDRWISLAKIWPLPVLMLVVIGGMFSGVLTATEAGAAGALGALIITLFALRSNKPMKAVRVAAVETVSSVGSIFILVIGAAMFGAMLSLTGLGVAFTDWVTEMGLGRVEFLLVIMVAYLILGMFMDPLSILLLTVPMLIPTLVEMDISLLWYGVFCVFLGELAILTPPVGMLSFIVHKIVQSPEVNMGQKITLGNVFASVGWFLPMALATCIVLILIPDIALWLPNMMAQ